MDFNQVAAKTEPGSKTVALEFTRTSYDHNVFCSCEDYQIYQGAFSHFEKMMKQLGITEGFRTETHLMDSHILCDRSVIDQLCQKGLMTLTGDQPFEKATIGIVIPKAYVDVVEKMHAKWAAQEKEDNRPVNKAKRFLSRVLPRHGR